MDMTLYFESESNDPVDSWYDLVGNKIKEDLTKNGYDCTEYQEWDEPDYRLDLKKIDKPLSVITVVYYNNPIKGSVTFEGENNEIINDIGPIIYNAVSDIKGIKESRWLSVKAFREVMKW